MSTRTVRHVVTAVMLGAAVIVSPAPAAPVAHLQPCKEAAPDGFCGTVAVPLDRAHPSRGTVNIFFQYYRHRDPSPASEAILVTDGGPGFSATHSPFPSEFHRDRFDRLRDTRDLILLDQRGVGRSDAIDCEQVQHGTSHVYRDVRACGKQLGFAAPLYGSGDVALDIEAVRRALGIAKLDFYGRSYAAQDLQSYAARFPRRLRSAVLDVPATTLGFNDFDAVTVRAIKHRVRLVCERSRSCSQERRNAVRAVGWLARRLQRQSVEGVGLDAAGDRHTVRVTEGFLLWKILNTEDGGFVAVSEVAAAADALRAGDAVPLLRLAAEGDGPLFGDEGDVTDYSAGDGFARYCTDRPMPWDKNASIRTRLRQWRAARAALPRNLFAPFSKAGWLAPPPTGPIGPDACIAWPAPKGRAAPVLPRQARFPASVPALILSGDLDADAPAANARRVAKAWPNSRYVEIANSGHNSGRYDCFDPMILNFIADLEPGDTSCASDTQFALPSVGRFPVTAADARPARRSRGDLASTPLDRKVAAAASAAVTDAFRRTFARDSGPGVGLRGGTFRDHPNGEGSAAIDELHGVRFARDVAVSGRAFYEFETEAIHTTVAVDGPGGEDGMLHVSGKWFAIRHVATVLNIRGTLGGRSVRLHVPAT